MLSVRDCSTFQYLDPCHHLGPGLSRPTYSTFASENGNPRESISIMNWRQYITPYETIHSSTVCTFVTTSTAAPFSNRWMYVPFWSWKWQVQPWSISFVLLLSSWHHCSRFALCLHDQSLLAQWIVEAGPGVACPRIWGQQIRRNMMTQIGKERER